MRVRVAVLVLVTGLAVSLPPDAQAGMRAPGSVVARADGSFEYDWYFVVEDPFVIAGHGASALNNTEGPLHGDCFCFSSCSAGAGDTIEWHVSGNLVDVANEGQVSNWIAPCEGEGESSVTRILPFGTTGVPIPGSATSLRLWGQPNPSRGHTRLHYVLPAAGRVSLHLYDSMGRRVARLVDGVRPAGAHSVAWDVGASDSRSKRGVYYARLKFAAKTRTVRIVVE